MALESLYTSTLLDHSNHPDYKYDMDDPTHTHRGVNPSCGDDITLKIRLVDGIIEEAAFVGSGCAISQASADIMSDIITDKTPEEALELADLFLKMIHGEIESEEELEPLGEAAELKDISHMPARVKCAVLTWRTLQEVLKEQ